MLTRKQPPPRTNQPGPREPLPVHMGLIGPVAECLCKTGLRIHFWSGVTRAKTLVGTRSVLIITHKFLKMPLAYWLARPRSVVECGGRTRGSGWRE